MLWAEHTLPVIGSPKTGIHLSLFPNSNLGGVAAESIMSKLSRHHWEALTHLGVNLEILGNLRLGLEDVEGRQTLTRKVVCVHSCDVILVSGYYPVPGAREIRIAPS